MGQANFKVINKEQQAVTKLTVNEYICATSHVWLNIHKNHGKAAATLFNK